MALFINNNPATINPSGAYENSIYSSKNYSNLWSSNTNSINNTQAVQHAQQIQQVRQAQQAQQAHINQSKGHSYNRSVSTSIFETPKFTNPPQKSQFEPYNKKYQYQNCQNRNELSLPYPMPVQVPTQFTYPFSSQFEIIERAYEHLARANKSSHNNGPVRKGSHYNNNNGNNSMVQRNISQNYGNNKMNRKFSNSKYSQRAGGMPSQNYNIQSGIQSNSISRAPLQQSEHYVESTSPTFQFPPQRSQMQPEQLQMKHQRNVTMPPVFLNIQQAPDLQKQPFQNHAHHSSQHQLHTRKSSPFLRPPSSESHSVSPPKQHYFDHFHSDSLNTISFSTLSVSPASSSNETLHSYNNSGHAVGSLGIQPIGTRPESTDSISSTIVMSHKPSSSVILDDDDDEDVIEMAVTKATKGIQESEEEAKPNWPNIWASKPGTNANATVWG